MLRPGISEHRKVSCLGRIYPFSLRVRRLASRHSKGVEYWGSGLEAVDPMATTGRGGNPHCPNVFGRGKGSRRSVQPFGTSSSRAGDRERPKPEVYSAAGDVSPQAGDREGPVSAHPLLALGGGRQGGQAPKQKGLTLYPAFQGVGQPPGSGATMAVELEGASMASARGPHLEPHIGRQMLENAAGRKSHL